MRFWERIREDSQRFIRIHKTLGEDLQGFTRLWGEDLRDCGRGFLKICETLGEDL